MLKGKIELEKLNICECVLYAKCILSSNWISNLSFLVQLYSRQFLFFHFHQIVFCLSSIVFSSSLNRRCWCCSRRCNAYIMCEFHSHVHHHDNFDKTACPLNSGHPHRPPTISCICKTCNRPLDIIIEAIHNYIFRVLHDTVFHDIRNEALLRFDVFVELP